MAKNKNISNHIVKKTNDNKKIKDSELILKKLNFLIENELINPSLYYNGIIYDYDGLDLNNLKKNWEY